MDITEYLDKNLHIRDDKNYRRVIKDNYLWWSNKSDWHNYNFFTGDVVTQKTRYSLHMAKKVCEDWASILLNEKTEIVVSGAGQKVVDEVLNRNNFWLMENQLVERTFAIGTGATLIRVSIDNGGEIIKGSERLNYVDARSIYPITVENGVITECAFVSEMGDIIYLETHKIEGAGYRVTNTYFKKTKGGIIELVTPEGMISEFYTPVKLFHVIEPNMVNPLSDSGLGLSVIQYSLDALKGVDLAYDSYLSDLELSKKMVFMKKSLIGTDVNGKKLAPQAVNQQLFVWVGEDNPNSDPYVKEFNPVVDPTQKGGAVQDQLDYLSFKVGFGTKHYQFNGGQIVTATQYMGDKQELVQNASKHYIAVEQYLAGITKSILALEGVNNEVVINFEDSYIIDEQTELNDLRQDVSLGIVSPIYYIMRKYGVDEEEAKKMQPTMVLGE